jgi:hypothetical protein
MQSVRAAMVVRQAQTGLLAAQLHGMQEPRLRGVAEAVRQLLRRHLLAVRQVPVQRRMAVLAEQALLELSRPLGTALVAVAVQAAPTELVETAVMDLAALQPRALLAGAVAVMVAVQTVATPPQVVAALVAITLLAQAVVRAEQQALTALSVAVAVAILEQWLSVAQAGQVLIFPTLLAALAVEAAAQTQTRF